MGQILHQADYHLYLWVPTFDTRPLNVIYAMATSGQHLIPLQLGKIWPNMIQRFQKLCTGFTVSFDKISKIVIRIEFSLFAIFPSLCGRGSAPRVTKQ